MISLNKDMPITCEQFELYSVTLSQQIDALLNKSISSRKPWIVEKEGNLYLPRQVCEDSKALLLKAVPHFIDSLDEQIKTQWNTCGLDSLRSTDFRNSFECTLAKKLTKRFNNEFARKVDVGLSNLLASHTNDVSHKPPSVGEAHFKLKKFSPVLARQVAELFERSVLEKNKIYNLNHQRLVKIINSFERMIPIVVHHLDAQEKADLFKLGLKCFIVEGFYNKIEYIGLHEFGEVTKKEVRFDKALHGLKAMFFKQDSIPNSHLRIEGYVFDLIYASSLTSEEFWGLKRLIEEIGTNLIKGKKAPIPRIKNSVFSTITSLTDLLNEELKGKYMSMEVKDRVSEYYQQRGNIEADNKIIAPPFLFFLQYMNPKLFGSARPLVLNTAAKFNLYLKSISSRFAQQYNDFLTENKAGSYQIRSIQNSFAKYLYTYSKDTKIQFLIRKLRNLGIEGLGLNHGEGFKVLEAHILANTKHKTSNIKQPLHTALNIYNLVTKLDTKLLDFEPFSITFTNENNDFTSRINLSHIGENYLSVYRNIAEYIEFQKNNTTGNAIQTTTLISQVNTISRLFKTYHYMLTPDDKNILVKLGLRAFGENNSQLLKHFMQKIQNEYLEGKIKGSTAIDRQIHLNMMVKFFGIEKNYSYRVSSSKTEILAKRKDIRNNYSFEQMVKFAYAIESSFKRANLSQRQILSLYVARILMKTGWNITPLLELDGDDLVYFDAPFNGNKTAAIRLFKRRAGYKTQWFNFALPEDSKCIEGSVALDEYDTGAKTSSVVKDLETVRAITKDIAKGHVQETFRNRIFSYSHMGRVNVMSYQSFYDSIDLLMKSEGVHENFTVTKIRKHSLNFIYKKVAREFAKYRKAGAHSAETFYRFYLRLDNHEVQESLSAATNTMSDFFLHDNSENIIFVEKSPKDSKKTPSGRCIQPKNSDVLVDFKKRNRNFLDDEQITGCADFGACLFCDYFRCVADAEGVWRLLSFREVVVQRMESASYSIGGDDGSDQQLSITRTKNRVNEILVDLAKINKAAVDEGQSLFETEGVHSDWEIL